MNELDKVLEKMRVRTGYTKKHVRRTHEILNKWEAIGWEEIINDIDDIVKWLGENSQYFPNYVEHIESWHTMQDIAKERDKSASDLKESRTENREEVVKNLLQSALDIIPASVRKKDDRDDIRDLLREIMDIVDQP